MTLRLSVLVILGLVARAGAEPIDAAIARASAAHKALVVEVGAEWCGPCKEFEKHILPDHRVQDALRSVVFVRYDADEPEGEAVVKRLQITGFPTFVVLGARGAEQSRRAGSPDGEDGVQAFLEIVRDAEGALDDELTIHAKLKAHPGDLGVELAAARWYVARKLPREALYHYESVASDAKASKLQRRTALEAAGHLKRVLAWRAQLIDDTVALLRSAPDLAEYDDLVLATVGSTLPPEEAKALVATVLAAQTDEDTLNGMVYVALAAGAHEAALTAAQKVVGIKRSPQFLDTLAEVRHARGEREEALKLEDEALQLAPTFAELIANRARFATSRRESNEIMTARARAEALRARFEKVDQLDRVSLASQPSTPKRNRAAEAMKAETALEKVVAKRCREAAGTSGYAHAQVVVERERITAVTPYTDALASAALRGCISRELLGQALLDPGLAANSRERTLTLKFKR